MKQFLTQLERLSIMFKKYGFANVFLAFLLLICLCILAVTLINKDNVTAYFQEQKTTHEQGMQKRIEESSIIYKYLYQIQEKYNASAIAIGEFHNGNTNVSGLPFNFFSITYEYNSSAFVLNSGKTLAERYKGMNTSIFNSLSYVYKKGYMYGNLAYVDNFDRILYIKLKEEGSKFIYIVAFPNRNLGFLWLTFENEPDKSIQKNILDDVFRLSLDISPMLDYKTSNIKT